MLKTGKIVRDPTSVRTVKIAVFWGKNGGRGKD